MKERTRNHHELFWPQVVMRKLLNISPRGSDYSADTYNEEEEDDFDSDSETEEFCQRGRKSRFCGKEEEEVQPDSTDGFPRLRRRNSETFRAQYINTKELRICVGTWNVGGKVPPDDLDIYDWIDINEPADIYVIGIQEIVPLNAGNIFGAEDSRPAQKWEDIIRETLNEIQPVTAKVKSYSDPPSPSKFEPSDDVPTIEEETLLESDSDGGEEAGSFYEVRDRLARNVSMLPHFAVAESNSGAISDVQVEKDLQRQYSSQKRLDRLNCLRMEDCSEKEEASVIQQNCKLTKLLSSSERIGLSWPEPPLNLRSQHVLERQNSFKATKSFNATNDVESGMALFAEIDLESLLKRKRRSSYARIVSKQMVGIFLTIWVRRSLRRHIRNLKVSTVGVGVMGYIGNKGAISVSMSIYQTFFCFICTHLTAGEKDGDELKRNTDVHEIFRRTHFHSLSAIGLPKSIHDHERIFWFGDLNYRLNLSYEKVRELISEREWSKLVKKDQLVRELRKGRAFDGWSEGTLNFAPTYKYEVNSEKYYGEDAKAGRRTPAWCDRILSYGTGMRQLNYRRKELQLSDHRPVTAIYMAEVEIFCPKKLQRALAFTDAEIENEEVLAEVGI
ncbi:hypothetical protein SLA2020_191330 [Shorea laevis]